MSTKRRSNGVLTIRFHPSDERLTSFAAGELEIGPSLLVSIHAEACPACRSTVQRLEESHGRDLESLPDAPLRQDALQRTLSAIGADLDRPAAAPFAPLIEGFRPPAALGGVAFLPPIHLTPEAWVAHLDAPRLGGWRTYLFCAPAGTALPEHGHQGEELIVVLDGAFTDGRQFGIGDFAENPHGFDHWMQVTPDGRCVAMISSAGPILWGTADSHIGELLDI